jgi:hypothetical protein
LVYKPLLSQSRDLISKGQIECYSELGDYRNSFPESPLVSRAIPESEAGWVKKILK